MIVEVKGGKVNPIQYRKIDFPPIEGRGLAIAPTNSPLVITAPIVAMYSSLVPWIGIYEKQFDGIAVVIEAGKPGVIERVIPFQPFCRHCAKETGSLFYCTKHRNHSITRQNYSPKTFSQWSTDVVHLPEIQ